MATREGCERLDAPVVRVRSQVGAGDSMVAGITSALAQDRSIREAVRYGIAAGSAAVMNTGTELCHRSDVDMLYRQMANIESMVKGNTIPKIAG